jgi:hypothetical protein
VSDENHTTFGKEFNCDMYEFVTRKIVGYIKCWGIEMWLIEFWALKFGAISMLFFENLLIEFLC